VEKNLILAVALVLGFGVTGTANAAQPPHGGSRPPFDRLLSAFDSNEDDSTNSVEAAELVYQALQCLAPADRLVISLFYLDG